MGTIISNRKGVLKNYLIKKRLKWGEYKINTDLYEEELCLKRMDTIDVWMLSACHKATATEVTVHSKMGYQKRPSQMSS